MNDQPRIISPSPAQRKMMQIRNHPYFKPALLAVAAAGGAFLAVRSSLKEITSDVHHMADHVHNLDHNVYNTSSHVIDEIHFQQKFRHNNKRAVQHAKEHDREFEYYPGLGTLVKKSDDSNVVDIDQAKSKKKAS